MRTAILISAESEWAGLLECFPSAQPEPTPFGAAFESALPGGEPALFFQGGWGKISAAASAQYVIDHWRPALLVNLGTCGGFAGRVTRGEIVLVEGVVVYDIIEMMGDPQAALDFYTTRLDLSFLRDPLPQPVRRGWMVSADRDLQPGDIPGLAARFKAVTADWETGAIAWVAARNRVPCLILRGVSDLVGPDGGEAYADFDVFHNGARRILRGLMETLPLWLANAYASLSQV